MTPIRLTRTARIAGAAGGIAALTLGFAVPALACDHPTSAGATTTASQDWQQLSLAQQQKIAQSVLAARAAGLDQVATKVAGDPNLTDAQKAAFQSKIDQDKAAISSAQSSIASAQSSDDIKAAFVSLWQNSAMPSFPQDHHQWSRDSVSRDAQAKQHPANAITLADKARTHSVDATTQSGQNGPCDHNGSDGSDATTAAVTSADNSSNDQNGSNDWRDGYANADHHGYGHDNWGGDNNGTWSGDGNQSDATQASSYQHDGYGGYSHDGYGGDSHGGYGGYQHDSHGGWGH